MNPYVGLLDFQRQVFERTAGLFERANETPEQTARIASIEVGETPSQVVHSENKLDLLHYEPLTDEQYDVPILVVYALINRPYILDLQPDRSVIRRLLENGFDVYLIDWGEPSSLDATLTLEDYVTRYIHNCVEVVRERSEQDAINLLGYCMGGTMSVMYSALNPENVRNLGLMAAGLCFDDTGGVLELWGSEPYDPSTVEQTFGNVPATFLDAGFALMDPVENVVSKYARLYDNLENDDMVENFARMERWLDDGIDVAGATYRQFLEDIYQENKLCTNDFRLGGRPVDISNITMPVLQIVADYDTLIPPATSTLFNDAIPSDDVTTLTVASGHIGLSVSSRAHGELWPDVCSWFADRSTGESTRPSSDRAENSGPSGSDGGEVTPDDGDSSLERIEGIGPAYARRLHDAGIETLPKLAEADPEALARATDIGEARVRDWVEAARGLEP
ncbi:MAG: class III poly(R)-hydroxyalkanoic acid synthase subunit PhaC [Halobacteriota archaeon]